MAILTHGANLQLAPTATPVVKFRSGTLRAAVTSLRKLGFQHVQLDATLPGTRPRELSDRARKDLVAMLMRQEVMLAGFDFFIPQRHFHESKHVDRAMAAATSAIALAADCGRVPLSIALPVSKMTDDARKALVDCADGHGVALAIHAETDADALAEWRQTNDIHALGAGLDAAVLLSLGRDVAAAIAEAAPMLHAARLSDLTSADASGQRCAVGEGELDVVGTRIALDLATHRAGPVVFDLRNLSHPLNAAAAGHKAWDDASISL